MDLSRDHILGNPAAEITVVEYGSYACPYCHAAHEIIASLRDRFGDRMRYVFRHRPITGSGEAERAAELAEYAYETTGHFWTAHDVLMKRGPTFAPGDFEDIAADLNLPRCDEASAPADRNARRRLREEQRGDPVQARGRWCRARPGARRSG